MAAQLATGDALTSAERRPEGDRLRALSVGRESEGRLQLVMVGPKAVEAVRLCWGGQIKLGASTFWEVFAPDWVSSFKPDEPTPGFANGPTSKCHPYASGVTTWMTQALHLGLRAVQI